ncbi:uncharacterized protein ATC70_006506 [Mucor velutinosus]|uniref:Uncharacterized protein n=1 Tax=Mucor velutinosus TaxID=708070 RepID=A0AAN7I3H5_9FUNG|nr:hypothetical protein ATC70_006506 [Mucor velutinosus]
MTDKQSLLTSIIPFTERPGTDKISKIILKHPFVKNIITVAILDVNGDNYRVGDAEWPDGSRSDVLYEPLDRSLKQSPIIVEVQRTVDVNFMARVVHYYVMAYRRYQVFPVLLVFAPEHVSIPTENMRLSNANGALLLNCEYWTRKGYLIRLKDVSTLTSSTDPFAAVSNFILQQQTSLLENNSLENLTIRQLFSIATEVLRENIDREQQLLNVINCACDVGVKHYQQTLEIAERLQYDSPCIQNEALLGISKLKQVKRSADDAHIDEEEPENTQLVSQDEERFENTMDFVQRYKETRNRMNWRGCHDILKKQTNVIHYKTSEVLRTVYNRFKTRS